MDSTLHQPPKGGAPGHQAGSNGDRPSRAAHGGPPPHRAGAEAGPYGRAWGHHLTDRRDSQYTALYLPVDVALPFQIDTSFYWERCTIGSAIRLWAELRELGPLVRQEARQPTNVVAQAAAARWEALLDIHRILLSYAQASIDLQQPLFVTW